MDRVVRIFLWLVFTVIFGMSPLIVRFVISRADENPISFSDTLKTGDLLIVGSVIAADAIGKILGVRHVSPDDGPGQKFKRGIRIVCGCACVLLLLLSCSEYSQVSGRIDSKTVYNSVNVIHDSLWIFFGTVVAGLGVIVNVEET
jgi:hypothetical protein